MNVLGNGVDLVDCQRVDQMVQRHGERFLRRVFTPAELDYCRGRRRWVEHLAGRFAAKEAVLKVLGTGWSGGIQWTDMEVVNLPTGRPQVRLSGECRRVADEMGIAQIAISISHTATQAMAFALGLGESRGGALGIGD